MSIVSQIMRYATPIIFSATVVAIGSARAAAEEPRSRQNEAAASAAAAGGTILDYFPEVADMLFLSQQPAPPPLPPSYSPTSLPTAGSSWSDVCPEALLQTMTVAVPFAQLPECGFANPNCSGSGSGSTLALAYHIVNSGKRVLCARLTRSTSSSGGGGYIGFGISPRGTMEGGMGIIGLPDVGTVLKYNLSSDPTRAIMLMADEYQTLMHTSIRHDEEDDDGSRTVMEFVKYLREDGEEPILANGENTFLYALGEGYDLGYHSERGSFILDFRTPSSLVEKVSSMSSSSSLTGEVEIPDGMDTAVEDVGNKDGCTASSSTTCTSTRESILCFPTSNNDHTPDLDGISDDWETVKVYDVPLFLTGGAENVHCPARYPYGTGSVQIQCVHDTERIYFSFHIPGPYPTSNDENHRNAARMAIMFKMGEKATLPDMGGCPQADDCTNALEICDPYKIDLVHWETKNANMGDVYISNGVPTSTDALANQYSVSSSCRYDDDGVNAGNEWEGAWSHGMPVNDVSMAAVERGGTSRSSTNITMAEVRKHNLEDDLWFIVKDKVYDSTDYLPDHPGGPEYIIKHAGEESTLAFYKEHSLAARDQLEDLFIGHLDTESLAEYIFEMSRPLRTASVTTDAQLEVGTKIDFGLSFWAPFESNEEVWTDGGYYSTGVCSKEGGWITLELMDEQIIMTDEGTHFTGEVSEVKEGTSSAAHGTSWRGDVCANSLFVAVAYFFI